MRSVQSSFPARVHVLRAIAVLTIIGIPFDGVGAPATKLLQAPLNFEPNQGQASSPVQFLSRGSGYALFLAPGKVALNLQRQQPASSNSVGMTLIGASTEVTPAGLAPLPGIVNYFIGNDPKKWRTGIHTYGKVAYAQIYPGVDLVFYGNQRQLEYDFVVAPGADPGQIAWKIDGARAALDAAGNLALDAPNGLATFEKPLVYQMESGRRTTVEGAFVLAGNQVRFHIGRYDRSKPLIIDPVLSYASYLAGSGSDTIGATTGPGDLAVATSQGLAVDSAGSAYVTGTTFSIDFPTENPYESAPPTKQAGVSPGVWASAFVTKFSPDGSSLVYSTYLGGNGADHAYAIAVDSSGNAYVTGLTNSVNFPVTPGAYQTICDPLPYNTGQQISAGCNSSNVSAFVTKLNPTGTGIIYSTFLGGYAYDYATAIAVDSAGRAYVAGNSDEYCSISYTFQSCFPTTSGAVIGGNVTGGGSPQYAFIAVFDPTGAHLIYSTLFGDLNGFACTSGCGGTYGTGVAVDANDYFYLIGNTQGGKLPTTLDVVQPTAGPLGSNGGYLPSWRGFIAKFNPVTSAGGATLDYCTYLGGHTGNTSDFLSGIAIDSTGNTYVVGNTNSADFPVTAGVYSTVCGPNGQTCAAAHVTKLNPTGTAILWSTFVGDSKADGSDALFLTGPIQLDGQGNIYIMGQAGSGFPLVNQVEPPVNGGAMEVVVAELDSAGANLLFSTRIGSAGLETSGPAGLAVDDAGDIYLAGNIAGPGLITTPGAFQTTVSSSGCCYHGFVAKISATTTPQITVTGSSSAVFNAATLQTGGIAPNEFISLKGTGLGPTTGAVSNMTTNLNGSSVYIDGTAAYLTYAQDGQINALVPFAVSGLQNTTIQVDFKGVRGNTVTVPVVASSPGIFTQSYGPGQAWMANQDGTFNSSSNPAPRGTYVAFWVTGQGLLNTTLADGTQPSGPPYPTPMLPVSVTLGGVPIPAANIAFDGLIYCGEVQINILIPANAPTGGAVPLVVAIGSASSRSDATIAIQ
jgi:uncharacterized protein (TIGR03437 family)